MRNLKQAYELEKEELSSLVEEVRAILYWEDGKYDLHKEWRVDHLADIADALSRRGLLPDCDEEECCGI